MNKMRIILLIGDSTLAPYTGPLEAEGFAVQHLFPGASEPSTGSPDAVVMDLSSAAEDPRARRYLEAASDGETPAVITLLPSAAMTSFSTARRPKSSARVSAAPSTSVTAWTREIR